MDNRYTLFNDTYVMYQLLEFIDENGIICLCKASEKLNEICKQYIELEDDKRFEIIRHNIYLLEKYCENNDVIKIQKMLKMNLNWNWNNAFYGACLGGHIDIVKFMIKKGTNHWSCGLSYACIGGNIDIVKLMIEKGADDWDSGLRDACRCGHMDIVKLMIDKGATECWNCKKSMEWHLS